MSRIFGLRGHDPRATARRLEHLLARAATSAGWTYESREIGPCGLGWVGRAPRTGATVVGPVTVALDGHVLNRDEVEPGAAADADAVARSYLRRGFEATLDAMLGEFAVALYDADEDVLWLGRDRIGLKPLYYAALGDGTLAFASQPATLVGLPGISATPNREFVLRYAGSHYRTFDDDATASPFAAISQLPAGHLIEAGYRRVRVRRWWSLEDRVVDQTGGANDIAEQYQALLLDSVRRRLSVCTRPAFTLSGGMDSSSVLSCAVAVTGGDRQVAYTSTYDDPTYDESSDVAPMLQEKVLSWHQVRVNDPDVVALVDEMIAIHHEPVITATWLSHYLVTRQAASHGRDALFGGMGGDELNAGEFEYFPYFFADLRRRGDEQRLAREIAGWARYHDHPIWRKDAATAERMMATLADPNHPGRVRPDRARIERYADVIRPDWGDIGQIAPRLAHPFSSYLHNRAFQDLFCETAPGCLRAEDRHATAFGLERFDPFLDHRVVELMFGVPETLKYEDGVTKTMLRRAMEGILPEATRTRVAKTGWNAPAHVWFSGAGADPIRDLIRSQRFRERGIYDVGRVDALLTEHDEIVRSQAVRENHMMFFWQLVNLDRWLTWLEDLGQTQSVAA